MWHLNMVNKTAYVSCVVGVLVFMSTVQAQDYGGTPGVDYPNYFTVPETSFKCSEQQYNPGFYADLETKCQAFHFCYKDRQETFLCPTGTIFNQAVLTCDIWHKSNCSLAPMFYSINVGPVMERAGKNLPMLLRLRNRSQNKPEQKSSAEVKPLHETGNAAPAETSIDEANKLSEVDRSLDGSSDKDKIFDSAEELNSEQEANANTYDDDYMNESADQEIDANLVYDPVSEDGYGNYDQYEADSEPVSEEFGRFYDYRNPGNEYGSERTSQSQFTFNDEPLDSGLNEYSDFTERSLRTGKPLRRVRRKPVYVVLDSEPASEAATSPNESNNASAQNESVEVSGINSSVSVDTVTEKPEPFPRPTRPPPHLLELSTETPMTSEEFGAAIFTELVVPHLPDDYGTLLASSYPQTANFTGVSMDTLRDDETIYVENDFEPDNERYEYQSDEPIYIKNDLVPENDLRDYQNDETFYIKNDLEPEDEPYAYQSDETIYIRNDLEPEDEPYAYQSDETIYTKNDLKPEDEPYEYQSDDETIYIRNDLEPEDEPYAYQSGEAIYTKNDLKPEDEPYEDEIISEPGEEEYEESYSQSSDNAQLASSDTDDTLVVIPDEYDDNGSVSNKDDFQMRNYPDENAYRAEVQADSSFEGYGNNEDYRYSSSMRYPQYYERTPMINEHLMHQKWFGQHRGHHFHPDMPTRMYQNDQRYSFQSGYEFKDQLPVSHESLDVDDTELYLHPKTEFGITDSPLELPATEEDLENFSTEDFGAVASGSEDSIEGEQEPNKPEDVYYVLGLDEEQSSKDNSKVEEDVNMGHGESLESSVSVEQNYETKLVNSTNEESDSQSHVPLDTASDKLESTKPDNGGFSSSLTVTENEKTKSPDNMKSSVNNPKDTLSQSNFEQSSQQKSPTYGNMPSLKTQPPVMSSFDFSTDSRFLNNMGYSESMDFGPYGFGPTMEQQFSMLESMPQSKSNSFSQRMGQTEQSKLSPLSAIQEKMRSMKQGKFGAFKKYLSSTRE